MRSSTGRWVIGDDFFDREGVLEILDSRVRAGNHVLLSGQRHMGKTSVLRELGRRLENDGYFFSSRLLKDWWAARVRNHHVALKKRKRQS